MEKLSRQELRALPKVELHNHLEGMVRLSTIIDLCHQFQIEVAGCDATVVPVDERPFREKFLGTSKLTTSKYF